MRIYVTIDETGADDERLATLAGALRGELRELVLADVRPVPAGEAPPGTRAVDLVAVSAFVVSLGGAAGAATQLATALRAWVDRGRAAGRQIEMSIGDRTLRIGDATPQQQDRVIEEFLRIARS